MEPPPQLPPATSGSPWQLRTRSLLGCLCCCLALLLAAAALAAAPPLQQHFGGSAAAVMPPAPAPASASAPPGSAAAFYEFGGPGCPCQPQNPQHPQQAFCASQFVVKVKVIRQIRDSFADSRTSQDRYLVAVRSVYRNSLSRQDLKRGRRVQLWVPSISDPCGMITVRQPGASIVSRQLMKRRSYLVTGNVDNGKYTLSVCSWLAFWPTKSERNRAGNGDFVGNRISKSQARYLRSRVYARDCLRCQVQDSPELVSSSSSARSTCRFNSGQDYNTCFASHAYCAHYTNPYTRVDECEWHTESLKRYKRCVDLNLQIEARRLGITG